MSLLLKLENEKVKQNEIKELLQSEDLGDLHSILRSKEYINGYLEQEVKIQLLMDVISKADNS